jgi:glutaredoxin-related protein
LFYGDTCPHCKTVSDWLEKNNVSEKVKFDHLEVYRDKNNSKLLTEKAKSCGLDEYDIGVPFLYDLENNKCVSGSDKIIEFFESKI